jgi:phosphate uptake regulator
MAAKNKRAHGTHSRASQHRSILLEEARSLLSAGKVGAARAVERRANQVDQLVGALESDVREELQERGKPN